MLGASDGSRTAPTERLLRRSKRLKKSISGTLDFSRLLRYDLSAFFRRAGASKQLGKATYQPRQLIPVCFTCAKHFEYVRLALFSLSELAPTPLIREVYIYVDKADRFSQDQEKRLRSESRYSLNFQRTAHRMGWAGVRVLLNELYAFQSLAIKMSDADVLMKFDSDVLFVSDTIFKVVADSDAGAIGTSIHQIRGDSSSDIQGGCYFIAARDLKSILTLPIRRAVVSVSREIDQQVPEDRVISHLLRQNGTRLILDHFLHFDSVLGRSEIDEAVVESRLQSIPGHSSVVHFEGGKSNMRRAARRLFTSLPPI